jgi:hypothetical protein
MRTLKVYSLVFAIIISGLVLGCASITEPDEPLINQKHFGTNKKFAVASIASLTTIQEPKGMSQMFRRADAMPGADTQPILNKLDSRIIRILGSSKQFTLLPESKLLTSKAYKSISEDERVTEELVMSDKINVAKHYKYVSDPQTYAQLAKDLELDGVIGITMHFAISSSQNVTSRMGLSLANQNYSVKASISVIAYNKFGEVIWKDSIIKGVDPEDAKAKILLDTSGMSNADFEKFHPSAVETGAKAVEVILARLDSMVAGNSVGRMQRIK